MPRVSAYVPAPYGGISQAAPQVRLKEQAEDLLNAVVDLPDGWRKRPPLTWVGKLLSSGASNTARAFLVKDPDDGSLKHIVVNRESTTTKVYLFDTDGSAITVNMGTGTQTYLNNASSPKSHLRISQAIDYTFLTARNKTVGTTGTEATRDHEALVFIKAGAYGKTYKLTVTPSGGSPIVGYVNAPNGSDPADSQWVDTSKLIQGVAGTGYTYTNSNTSSSSAATALASAGFTVAIEGATLYLSHSTDFTVVFEDGSGGTTSTVAKDTVDDFAKLPDASPVDGFTVSVVPQRGDKSGAYWVKYNKNPAIGEAPWQECLAPGAALGIDKSTLPVTLSKDGSGNWNVAQGAWKQRTVGDENLVIDPLFVGDTIQDVCYTLGRLALISGEEAFLTAADDPFRIYRATMLDTLDSDPFSLVAPLGRAQFRSATPFEKGTVVTGIRQQCIIRSVADGPIKADNVKMDTFSNFTLDENTQNLRPIGNHNKVYLPVPTTSSSTVPAEYVGIDELAIDRISGEDIANDLTAQCPNLIPIATSIAATSEKLFMTMYAQSGSINAWLHVHRYADNQRVQNGIFPIKVPSGYTIVDVTCDGTVFYFYMRFITDNTLHLFTMEMSPKALDADSSSTVLTKLDLKQTETQVASRVYTSSTDSTLITFAAPIPSGLGYVAARAGGSGDYPEGYLAEVVTQTGTASITVKGDWTSPQNFYAGCSYNGYWKPSRIYMLGQDQRVIHSGRLTLEALVMDLLNSTSLSATISVASRSVRSYDLKQNVLGSPQLYTGDFRVPIKGEASKTTIEINDSGHVGSTITGFEWFAQFTPKSQRTS